MQPQETLTLRGVPWIKAMHDLSTTTLKYTCACATVSQGFTGGALTSHTNTQLASFTGTAAAVGAKQRDKNSLVLLFEAVLML